MDADPIEARERERTIGPDEGLVKTHLAWICGQDKNLYPGINPSSGGLNTEMRTLCCPLSGRWEPRLASHSVAGKGLVQ